MRIIHTSDWHVGSKLYDRDRSADHRQMTEQIIGVCRYRRPDALIISGDLFDNDHPSASDQRLVADTLARLRTEVPGMTVVAVAGNHDSPSRHESHRAIYAASGIHMIGRMTAGVNENPGCHIIDAGAGVIVAIPYYIGRGCDLKALMAEAGRVAGDRPVIATGHTMVTGSDTLGHDERIIGLLSAVEINSFLPPDSYDYLALGHIHRAQKVGGSGKARYSGSPLAISFDETYPHYVTAIEVDSRGGIAETELIEIAPHRPLVTLPSPGRWVPLDEALACLAEFPRDIEAFIRLNVLSGGPLPPSAGDDARRKSMRKKCEVCHINVRYSGDGADDATARGLTVDELREASPVEIASRYAASVGMELDRELFEEILREVTVTDPDDETA